VNFVGVEPEEDVSDVALLQQPLKLHADDKLHLVGSHNLTAVDVQARAGGSNLQVLADLPLRPTTGWLKVWTNRCSSWVDPANALPAQTGQQIGTAVRALTNLISLDLGVLWHHSASSMNSCFSSCASCRPWLSCPLPYRGVTHSCPAPQALTLWTSSSCRC
jgi:hypothetical protein